MSGLDTEEKSVIKKANSQFERGDYQNALNDFLTIYSQNANPAGLQFSIAVCLAKLNKTRQARLFAFKELLDYPDNVAASRFLAQQFQKINGKSTSRTFNNKTRPEKYPDISLVMIVKNEEKDLPRCLESYKDIVKEMIIVDTGSTDRTVEIAKSYGARVEYFEWCDDFAKARNESLKYATCEWMLRTDADEYIEESEKIKLLHCLNSGAAEVYVCPTISTTKDGVSMVENARLIKNHIGIKYDFPIHETVAISTTKLGYTQCVTNIEFMHTGYHFDEDGLGEKKIQRNIDVCDAYLEKSPNDYFVRIIRGLFKHNVQKKMEGLADIEFALSVLPEDTLPIKYLGLGYFTLIHEYIKQNREIDLYNVLLDAQIDFFNFSCVMQYVGQVYLYNRGEWKKANKLFNWITKTYFKRKTYYDVLDPDRYNKAECINLLGDTYVLLKNYEKAKKVYLLAKKEKKDELDSKLYQKEKQVEDMPVEFSSSSSEELRVIAKEARTSKKWLHSFRMTLWAAAKSELTFQDYLDLATCQVFLNHNTFAQLLLDEASISAPGSASILNLESLIAARQGQKEKSLQKAVEALIKEPGSTIYQNNVEQVAGLLKMTPVQAIRKTGMDWINAGRITDGLFALVLYLKFVPNDEEVKKIITKYSN